jgi:recombination protein RecT
MAQENNNKQGTTTQPVAAPATQPTATQLQKKQKDISDKVLERVSAMTEAGQLQLPQGYHAGNAVRAAWLYLQEVKDKNYKPALEVCTQNSIANCLLEMIIKGLNIAKKQCYFIVAGNQLTFWEDYRGKLMRTKRDTDIADVHAQVVYEGDEFVYTIDELGQYQLVSHKTKLENMDITKITAAYAIVVRKDGSKYMELMSMAMIKKSWMQGAAKGNSGAHNNFTDQMCKKTVISRACKVALGSSEDELQENDPAAMERAQAQQPAAQPAIDADFEEVKEATEVVDTETGEVLQPAAQQPAAAPAQPAAQENDCPI